MDWLIYLGIDLLVAVLMFLLEFPACALCVKAVNNKTEAFCKAPRSSDKISWIQ